MKNLMPSSSLCYAAANQSQECQLGSAEQHQGRNSGSFVDTNVAGLSGEIRA